MVQTNENNIKMQLFVICSDYTQELKNVEAFKKIVFPLQ